MKTEKTYTEKNMDDDYDKGFKDGVNEQFKTYQNIYKYTNDTMFGSDLTFQEWLNENKKQL